MPDDVLTTTTAEVINRFNAAINQHDVDTAMALMTDDCVFENTYPPPDGERYEGQKAVRAFWEDFFRSSSHAAFQTEEMITCANRCVVRWRYDWTDADRKAGHIRGVDVFLMRDGKIAEKLSYVKG
jgi:ketosteroid isomerase-like protein